MPKGRRCATGCQTWPNNSTFADCLLCGEETLVYDDVQPMDEDEALSLYNQVKFAEFYEEWDARMPPERLDPNLIP